MALIQIDALPNLEMVDLSMAMLNNQIVDGEFSKAWMINAWISTNIPRLIVTPESLKKKRLIGGCWWSIPSGND